LEKACGFDFFNEPFLAARTRIANRTHTQLAPAPGITRSTASVFGGGNPSCQRALAHWYCNACASDARLFATIFNPLFLMNIFFFHSGFAKIILPC